MKRIFLTFSICLLAMITNAQLETQAQLNAFRKYSDEMDTHVHEMFTAKNYNAVADTLNLWLDRYAHLSHEFQLDVKPYKTGAYYNLACAYSRLHKNDAAITNLEKSIDAGYIDYAHIMVDNDLDNIRNDSRFKSQVEKIREKGDYGYILQKSGAYNTANTQIPTFTYQSASDTNLVKLRNKFNLDSVAGNGDEISKIKRLLYWAHNSVRHDGNSSNPNSRNAIDLIAVCQKENRGVNCRMMSTILRDACQAEGFDTRVVTCLPKDTLDNDCHVITVVWSKSLNKWIWMDPTFNAYVTDDKGNLLSIQEVREKLVSGAPLVLNDDANWNNKVKQTKANYLDYYMSKNLYWLQVASKSEWNIETYYKGKPPIDYINLYPGGFNTIHTDKKVTDWSTTYATNNPNLFWQKPTDGVQ